MTTTRTVDAAGYDCGVTIHRPETEQDRHTAVLYLHGGGLLYGERDDLPRPYIDAFLAEGYTLLCLDYPLAPEVSVGVIHQAVLEGWLRLLEEEGVERYFLFGRSAGAYLALILAKSLAGQPVPQPAGVLDFYGYYDMADPFVTAPSPYYKTLPEVPRRLVERFFGGAPVTAGPKTQRFSLYIHARHLITISEPVNCICLLLLFCALFYSYTDYLISKTAPLFPEVTIFSYRAR